LENYRESVEMKKPVIALQIVKVGEPEARIILPEGCTGMLLVFESKKFARKFWGKGAKLQEIKLEG